MKECGIDNAGCARWLRTNMAARNPKTSLKSNANAHHPDFKEGKGFGGMQSLLEPLRRHEYS